MEVANWRKWVANWRKGVANRRKGEEQIWNVNHGESSWKCSANGSGKLEEESGKLEEGSGKLEEGSRTNKKCESRRNSLENAVQMEVANWRKGVANWRKGVVNWRKGEKQLHSRTQCTFASFVSEKVWLHVLTIPIMCTFLHFLWKIFPQSAIEEKFPCFRPFVLPTLYTRGAGNLTKLNINH